VDLWIRDVKSYRFEEELKPLEEKCLDVRVFHMTLYRRMSTSKIMLDDNTNHDSSTMSASTSNNEESFGSCSNDRFVVGSGTKKTSLRPSLLIGSDDDSDHISLQVNSSFSVGKVGINQHTQFESSTNENRPMFSISFRSQDVARLVPDF
jgi:hypothetical protein